MSEKLTYKKKNKMLLILSVAILFLIYMLSIRNTIQIYSQYTDSKAKMDFAENAPVKAMQLKKQLTKMDSNIGRKETSQIDIAQSLLELVTNYCQDNQVILREFPEGKTSSTGDLLINTNPIVVEGGFSSLLRLVYLLEQKVDLGKIASVKYSMIKDRKSKEMALIATIYIQNIKKIKNENPTEK